MSEGSFDAPPSHPDLSGQELDTIPVTQHTIKRLRTTVSDLIDTRGKGRFRSDTTNYLVDKPIIPRKPGDIVSIIKFQEVADPDGPETLYRVYDDSELGATESLRMGKDIFYSTDLSRASEPVTDGDRTEIVHERAAAAAEAAEVDKQMMEELTGLPHISEGEIRRLIAGLKSDKLQKI